MLPGDTDTLPVSSPPPHDGGELYRALFESSPIAIELYDEDGRLVSVNAACLELFGVTDQEEISDFDLFADSNVGSAEKERLRRGDTIRYGAPFDFQKVRQLDLFHTSRRGTAWLDIQISPLHSGHVGYLVQVQEITAQRDAEQAIRTARSHLEAMIHALPDLLFLVDGDGRILEAYTSATDNYYVPPSVFLGKSLAEVLPADAARVIMDAVGEAAAHGVHHGATYSLPMPQGIRWYELSVAVVGRRRQSDPRYVILVRDVTARQEAEEALQRRVAELDALRQMSELVVRRVDVSEATDSVCRLLQTLVAADQCSVELPDDTAERIASAAGAPLARDDDGHVLVVPLVAHEETLGSLVLKREVGRDAFTRDETTLITTAADLLAGVIGLERLHAREREEAADDERRRIARDLHDAVTQHIHAANMLAATMPAVWARDAAEGQDQLERIQGLLRAAFAELRILLYELRPETLRTTPLQTLFERLRDALAGRGETAVEMSVAADLDLPADVTLAMYRIAQEALNNVAKHAQARHVTVIVAHDDAGVRLTVSDDGLGFTTGQTPPGMGQSIMRERAAGIGATLTVSSTPGAGTTVTMTWHPQAAAVADGRRRGVSVS